MKVLISSEMLFSSMNAAQKGFLTLDDMSNVLGEPAYTWADTLDSSKMQQSKGPVFLRNTLLPPPGLSTPRKVQMPKHGKMSPATVDSDDNASLVSAKTVSTSATSQCPPSNTSDEERRHSSSAESSCSSSVTLFTTVMMRNIPNNVTRAKLLDLMNAEGFAGTYDFVYLPIDFKSKAGLGYSFVNFADPDVAERFHSHFSGFNAWDVQSDKVCETNWSEALQGREAHVERYKNSPVMHHSMPEECRPLLFKDGVPVPFPAPTVRIRAPRQYSRKH